MNTQMIRVLVTGANGFIGKNMLVHLNEHGSFAVSHFVRSSTPETLQSLVANADAIMHLAGENRPLDESAFTHVNAKLTTQVCQAIEHVHQTQKRFVPLVFASSIQAERDNPYGRSKREGEAAIEALAHKTGNPCVIFRLPGVFGKWCKPNYNSVVATFCHNIPRGLPIQINDPNALLRLVYVDDVIRAMMQAMHNGLEHSRLAQAATLAPSNAREAAWGTVEPEYEVRLGELANHIESFKACRTTLMTERVGTGFMRALYSTYVSYLPVEQFAYTVPQHADARGTFVEMLKTHDSGQFSYFTAHPGVTRGGHYHHTKTEKFLVIKGEALFRFRHLITNETFELQTSGQEPKVVDTIPGWSHDITNIGQDEMVVMLWANENFDRQHPDTIASKV